MEIGQFRDRVTVQRYRDIEQVGGSGTLNNYTDVITIWANVVPIKGLTTLDTKQIGVGVTHTVTCRYHPQITSETWLLFKNRRLRIRTVNNVDEMNRWQVLLCEQETLITDTFQAGENVAGDDLGGVTDE